MPPYSVSLGDTTLLTLCDTCSASAHAATPAIVAVLKETESKARQEGRDVFRAELAALRAQSAAATRLAEKLYTWAKQPNDGSTDSLTTFAMDEFLAYVAARTGTPEGR